MELLNRLYPVSSSEKVGSKYLVDCVIVDNYGKIYFWVGGFWALILPPPAKVSELAVMMCISN